MKRCSLLVNYTSSEESEREDAPKVKRRKLPTLAKSVVLPVPVDDPSLHQGRIRSQPHIEGQFVAHVYISFVLDRRSALYKLVRNALDDSKTAVPALRDFWSGADGETLDKPELHISLTRPAYLRPHQREDLKRVVKALAKEHKPFTVSFATFTELINDECTRTFLAMEIGAGHHELRSLSDALSRTLKALRQQEYYPNPRFHASIAWALLDHPKPESSGKASATESPTANQANLTEKGLIKGSAGSDDGFPTIPALPSSLFTLLKDRYCTSLVSTKVGTLAVEAITVKIGKDQSSWRLSGL